MSPWIVHFQHDCVYTYVCLLIPVIAFTSFFNFLQMVGSEDMDLSFSWDLSSDAVNYKLGIAVQSLLVGLFCTIAVFSEVMALTGNLSMVLPFMEKEMGRAVTHLLVAFLALGFCGGAGMYCAIVEGFFAVMFYLAATAEDCNAVERNSDNGISETSG